MVGVLCAVLLTGSSPYVSIIIHLEVANINVWNFNFPLGLYSSPQPIWTPSKYDFDPISYINVGNF
jgi:hypothetical protein